MIFGPLIRKLSKAALPTSFNLQNGLSPRLVYSTWGSLLAQAHQDHMSIWEFPLWTDASNTQSTVDVHCHEPSQNESQFLLWKAKDTS